MAAARRAYWKGYLKLPLVTAPVALYPASSQAEKTHFHQINRKTGNRLRQQMVDEKTGKVVEKDDKSRGYEVSKGKYVEIEPDEIKAIQVESTHTIDIAKFVPTDEIDRRYYDNAYYIVRWQGRRGSVRRHPRCHEGQRASRWPASYSRTEHITNIEPFGKGMLGTTLRYDFEVRDEGSCPPVSPAQIPKEMVSLASPYPRRQVRTLRSVAVQDEFELELRKL
jgi:Ku protein